MARIAQKPVVHPVAITAAPEAPPERAQSIDINDAEAAFVRLQPRLEALSPDELLVARIDLQTAALVGLRVARQTIEAAMRYRLQTLAHTGEFDFSHVELLPDAALAAWYARHRAQLATATQSTAQLPASLVEDGQAIRKRMLKVLDYHLGDDELALARLDAIRAGSGHLDLANDLVAVAALYQQHGPALAEDRRYYRAGDELAARQLAGEMLSQLSRDAPTERARWGDLQSRAWTLLHRTYDEVRRAGTFLFHHDGADRRFPSLVTAGRKPGRSTPPAGTPTAPG